MNEIPCYDLDGNTVINFTQWDINQTILLDGNFNSAYSVDFSNKKHDVSYRMDTTLVDGQLQVDIPNILLTESETIYLFIFKTNKELQENLSSDTYSGRTCYIHRIPVKPKAKPHDYIYEDNVDYVSLLDLKKKIIDLNNTLTENELKRVENENTRSIEESKRKDNESTRINNENVRIENETKRSEAVSECKIASDNANAAAEKATNATNNLEEHLSNKELYFNEYAENNNIISGDTFAVLFGKIQKWYAIYSEMLNDEITSDDVDMIFLSEKIVSNKTEETTE